MTDYYKDFYEKPEEGDVFVRRGESVENMKKYIKAIEETVVDDTARDAAKYATSGKPTKYHRRISHKDGWSDVYDVLFAYDVVNPAIAHAIKKMLCAGTRGYKDFEQDVQEAIDSLERAKDFPPVPF